EVVWKTREAVIKVIKVVKVIKVAKMSKVVKVAKMIEVEEWRTAMMEGAAIKTAGVMRMMTHEQSPPFFWSY
ncbi:MAG TPA: hypothetical protein VEY51_02740, partial [Chondromyces sp.]|nr:hypothetical protein [Chondromyces sp.]